MTVVDATAAYETARVAYLRAADDLRAALEAEAASLLDGLPADLHRLAAVVSAEWQVEICDLLGRSKRREHSEPRIALLALARAACAHYTLERLGRWFRRDHGTILHAQAAIRRLCDSDPVYRARVARVRAAISASGSVVPPL